MAMLMLSREVRRVPLDFDWPLDKTWEGYLLPERLRLPPCPTCGPPVEAMGRNYGGGGDGMSPLARSLSWSFYALGVEPYAMRQTVAWNDKITQAEVDNLLERGRLTTLVEDDSERGWTWQPLPRTAAEVNAAQEGMGLDAHDGINQGILVQYRCKLLGGEYECETCGGDGYGGTKEQRELYDAWEPHGPPKGDAFQMWETVSEGSPISPPFATERDLAQWLAANEALGLSTRSEDEWMQVIADQVHAIDVQSDELR